MNITFIRRKGLGKKSVNGIIREWKKINNNVNIDVIRSDAPLHEMDNMTYIRWGCTSFQRLEKRNIPVINPHQTISIVNNKCNFRYNLQYKIPENIPPTIFYAEDFTSKDFNDNQIWLGRPSYHSQGKNCTIIKNMNDLDNDMTSTYWSKYIKKDKEYRVYMMFDYVAAIAEKVVDDRDAILWNKFQVNSTFENIRWNDWPINILDVAFITDITLSGLHFSGIDIMVKDNIPYVLEVNSAPTISSLYCQKVFAKIFNWELCKGENEKNIKIEYNRDYKKYIHPALLENN